MCSGVEYPVHPIDAVSAALDNNGEIICFSGFPVGDAGNSGKPSLHK